MQTSQTATAARPKRLVAAESLISHIRELSVTLQESSPAQLAAEARSIRSEVAMGTSITAPEIQVAGIALALEAMRRSLNVTLYDQQLLAVIHLTRGHIVQMHTGEGKTFAAIATAGHLALAGKGVHVMTPNSYLAERDCQTARTILQPLQMTVGQTVEQADPVEKQAAYECDVTYGTGHEFGFDYLRDQLTLRQQAETRLGSRLLQDLRTADRSKRSTLQRGLQFAVVDEADSVLIDDAGSPLVLSMHSPGTPPDLQAHLVACEVADVLQPTVEFEYQPGSGLTALTLSGKERCYADDIAIPTNVLLRPWTAYVEQALRAKYQFRRNVHYVVLEDQVKIVDATTGRIFEDRSWQDGLHQAIEAREGLPITSEKAALARITRQRFFRLYQNLCGMTGTAIGCESELKHVYRVTVQEIPLRLPSARTMLPLRCFATLDHKHAAIVKDMEQRHAERQPVLVGTQSITDSEAIAKYLQDRNLPFELLNGLQTAEEAHIIAAAGQPGAITISTNLAGRGTDINVPPASLQTGGLHVIVAECQLSGRMDRQLIGRCARQGQPGSAQMFVSADDALLMRYGDWLSKAIRREAGRDGEAPTDILQPLKRLQLTAEKQQFLMRAELLRQDLSRDVLFGNA
jgi:preprotein translocase subunit SecA